MNENQNPAMDPDAFLAGLGLSGAAPMPDPIGGIAPPPLSPGDPRVNEQLSSGKASVIYRQGDELAYLEGMPLELRVRLQDQLVSLGLARGVLRGEMDDATIAGLGKVMSLANRSGTTWRQTLNRLTKLQTDGVLGDASELDIPTYRPPDYASLAQAAKDAVRDRLGFDPTDEEMTLLADELSSLHRKSYDADVQAIRDTGAGREVGAPEVDVASRFQSFFEEKFAPQIAVVDEGAQVSESANEAQAQLGNVARQVGV